MDEGAPPNDGADKRIYALLAVAEEQQTAVRSGIEGMALERAAMATERVALVQQAERMERLSDKLSGQLLGAIPKVADSAGQAAAAAVSKVLQGTVVTAIGIAATAAQPTLESFREAVGSAGAVQLELRKAVKHFGREWAWVVAFAIASLIGTAVIVAYASVWSQRSELRELEAKRDKLQAEMSTLQEQVDQAKRNNGRKPGK